MNIIVLEKVYRNKVYRIEFNSWVVKLGTKLFYTMFLIMFYAIWRKRNLIVLLSIGS